VKLPLGLWLIGFFLGVSPINAMPKDQCFVAFDASPSTKHFTEGFPTSPVKIFKQRVLDANEMRELARLRNNVLIQSSYAVPAEISRSNSQYLLARGGSGKFYLTQDFDFHAVGTLHLAARVSAIKVALHLAMKNHETDLFIFGGPEYDKAMARRALRGFVAQNFAPETAVAWLRLHEPVYRGAEPPFNQDWGSRLSVDSAAGSRVRHVKDISGVAAMVGTPETRQWQVEAFSSAEARFAIKYGTQAEGIKIMSAFEALLIELNVQGVPISQVRRVSFAFPRALTLESQESRADVYTVRALSEIIPGVDYTVNYFELEQQ
jgi:hypothetical protein